MTELILVENADVEVKLVEDKKKNLCVQIIVDNKYTHIFDSKTREARMVSEMEISVFSKLMNGGTYIFTHDGKLVDYRNSAYKGFRHSEDAIKTLSDKIGYDVAKEESTFMRRRERPISDVFGQFRAEREIFLGGLSEPFYLDIASLGEGGSFKNRIVYKWNPFDSNILTTIEVERLICLNGMVGISPLVTRKVPIINDWERHLEIVSLQIKPTVNALLQDRFIKMSDTHASVANVLEARQMLLDRSQLKSVNGADQLSELIKMTDVQSRLRDVYRDEVFKQNGGRAAASDLTQFDLFNILTETCSHTAGTSGSNEKIQKFLNKLTFDYNKNEISGNAKISQESDHRRVFFGKSKNEGDVK